MKMKKKKDMQNRLKDIKPIYLRDDWEKRFVLKLKERAMPKRGLLLMTLKKKS